MHPSAETAGTPLEVLHALVLDLFNDEEFRRWIALGAYADVLVELPGNSASIAEVVDKALGVLTRRGLIDDAFFDGLTRARERKRDAIESVRARWTARVPPCAIAAVVDRALPNGPSEPASLPLPHPFWPAGTMPPNHDTYVRRACDRELSDALGSASFIAVEGPSAAGKSSLVRQIGVEHGTSRRFCHVDLDTLRHDHPPVFMEEFFERISERLERTVRRWTDLVIHSELPLVLVLDEFGSLSSELTQYVVPPLFGLDRDHPHQIQVLACYRVEMSQSLVGFLHKRGVTAGKYCDRWHMIRVQLFGPAEIQQLVAHLPPSAAAVARAEVDTIARLSGGSPAAVQCACGKLYTATHTGASGDHLRALIRTRGTYR